MTDFSGGAPAAAGAHHARGGVPPLRRLVAPIYLLALAIDLAFGFALRFRPAPALLEADEQEYWAIAGTILHGTIAWDARRTLAYPMVLAAIRAIRDDVVVAQVVMTALFALSAPLLALLVDRLSGSRPAAVAAGVLWALWPAGAFFGASLYSESAALPAFLATLLVLPLGGRAGGSARARLGAAAAAGALLGLTTMLRPMYLLFTPFLALILLIEERRWRVAAARVGAAALGFAVPVLPWAAAMTLHFHHPILITANGGETLAGGINPVLAAGAPQADSVVAGRRAWNGPGKWIPVEQTGYLSAAERRALPYDRADALLRARTRAWITDHPADAARLEAAKLGYMWGLWPLGRSGTATLLAGEVPAALLLLAWAGTLIAWPAARTRFPRLWLLPLFVSGIALISWGSWRFRQPADAGLVGLAAIAAVHVWTRRRATSSAR